MNGKSSASRRKFIKTSASMAASLAVLPDAMDVSVGNHVFSTNTETMATQKSLIGTYGEWASSLVKNIPALSFRNAKWNNVKTWQKEALAKTSELIFKPDLGKTPPVTVEKKYAYDGLDIEELSWQLPYGRPTKAYLLKPQGATKPLPAILALHDHGGNKYFGKRKIVRLSDDMHPLLVEHQEHYYGGKAWANELAKRGYVVLVHDTFAFESRRVLYDEVAGYSWGPLKTEGKSDADPEKTENIQAYNTWAGEHEHVMSKSLFCGGTTWPGVVLAEDQIALDILSNRSDVDKNRIGCAGLSGGGLRTAYLGGLDARIKCAVCVGFMSTWDDFILYKSYTHTWMLYVPLLPNYLDFPEILGIRAPLPTMVQNNNDDDLFTLPEMKKADNQLREIFAKAGAGDKYQGKFYDGEHKFDQPMQKDAFEWFDKWLS
ncbi:dienelactone hydrolase family protein [Runella salmonicolor]|uniref:Alpha/beta hydrolase family protein n=1 Tax=Runella salmonicolor TaxID=2950278 RepID=A0ABT1FKU8_9BACT|nr:alpha/beta hydrolase family protein [Runella salmonicolor]MCP1382374.1 alpha/beta hydrolase family protein [Runella salmonicolor]